MFHWKEKEIRRIIKIAGKSVYHDRYKYESWQLTHAKTDSILILGGYTNMVYKNLLAACQSFAMMKIYENGLGRK